MFDSASRASQRLQLNSAGKLKHFVSIDGLPRETLVQIMDVAESFLVVGEKQVKKVPVLRGKTIVNLFFENSTRTRTTFEIAAKRLSADVINLNVSTSAASKGETLLDTVRNLEAMHSDMFVIRHASSGAASFVAKHVAPGVSVINAGDGSYGHPTQALLDMLTIRKHKGSFDDLSVVIIGDLLHSRVARSQIHALRILGVKDIRVVAPRTLTPSSLESFGVSVWHDLDSALEGVDVVIMLRLQRERMRGAFLPGEQEYYRSYGLTEKRLTYAKPDAIVMHPGPMNRGIEVESSVVDGPQSVVLDQVSYGIAVRMAVMALALGNAQVSELGAEA